MSESPTDRKMDAYETSAEYRYIEIALKSLWQPFTELVGEMDAFIPRPLAAYTKSREQRFEHLKSLNPSASDQSLLKLIDDQIAFEASERVQFSDRFSNRFMTTYVMVVFLSQALCEAAINAILAIGLAKRNLERLFTTLEKKPLKYKWRVGPQSFFPNYQFSLESRLYQSLDYLTQRRNALVHYKIDLRVAGQNVLDGSRFERTTFSDSTEWMRRFFSLPYDLATYARKQLQDPSIFVLYDRQPIAAASAHNESPH